MHKRPNIVFITTDQQNCNTLGCYGGKNADTPNLDHFASESLTLDGAYVTCPLCVPSRGSMMLGRYPHVSGVMLNDDGREITEHRQIRGLSDVLYDNGYNCAYFGKWHLGHDDEVQHSFYAGWQTFLRESYEDWLVETGKFTFPEPLTMHRRAYVPYELAHDTYTADRSIAFLEEHCNDEKPFALWCAMRAPHDPYVGPMTDSYRPEDMVLPDNCHDTLEGKPHCQQENWSQLYKRQVEGVTCDEDFKEVIARYQGLTKLVDVNAGRVLEAIDRLGLRENTIVVFHSDHGDMMGSHGMLCKGPYMYEETNRVPFIIRYPGKIPEGKHMRGLFSLLDIAPTILDLAGVTHQEAFDGVSGASAMCSASDHNREAVFAEIFEIIDQRAVIFSVRTEKWKYNFHCGDMDELYDMEKDPLEMQNLAENPDYTAVVAEMQERLAQWLRETGADDWSSFLEMSHKSRPMNYLSYMVGQMSTLSI